MPIKKVAAPMLCNVALICKQCVCVCVCVSLSVSFGDFFVFLCTCLSLFIYKLCKSRTWREKKGKKFMSLCGATLNPSANLEIF